MWYVLVYQVNMPYLPFVISLIVGLQVRACSRTGLKWSRTVRSNFPYGFSLLHFNTGEYHFMYSLYLVLELHLPLCYSYQLHTQGEAPSYFEAW